MKFPLCNREAEGSARPKTSFFLKRGGPLVLKRHFSWSGGVRSSQNVVFLEAEGSARPKMSFFLKRRGPLAPKRRFSWSNNIHPSLRATEGSVAIQIVFLVAYFIHSSLKESPCLSFPFPYPILLGFLTVKRPHTPKEMKASPKWHSGSVGLVLIKSDLLVPA